jgi:hypothetical protein
MVQPTSFRKPAAPRNPQPKPLPMAERRFPPKPEQRFLPKPEQRFLPKPEQRFLPKSEQRFSKPQALRPTAPALRPVVSNVTRTDDTGADEKILFQKYFKSVGPRTYAVQVKEARNGNHALVLIEGKRDDKSGEVRKHRLYLWSEDFVEFFRMLQETVQFIKTNPVPESIRRKRKAFWAKQDSPRP